MKGDRGRRGDSGEKKREVEGGFFFINQYSRTRREKKR